jgi:general stress protein YciG
VRDFWSFSRPFLYPKKLTWWAEGVIKMAGTKDGGKKAAATNKAKYGKEFYATIGRKGGQNGTTGGFAANKELARIAGAKGGRISRRGKAKKTA